MVAAAGVGIALATGRAVPASGRTAPCVRQTFPPMGRQHIEKLSKDFRYNSFPPTSGPHYPPGPKAPGVWNLYDAPVDETGVIHNLEHGGVVVQYGPDVPHSTVQEIRTGTKLESPDGLVVAPLSPSIQATPPPRPEQEDLRHLLDAPDDVLDLRQGRLRPFPGRLPGTDGRRAGEVPAHELTPGRQ